MILAADAGNTTISFGLFEGSSLTGRFKIKTDRNYTAAEIEGLISDSFIRTRPERAVFSSVVPEVDAALYSALEAVTGGVPLVMSPDLPTDILFNRYDRGSIGADRIADLAAARDIYGAPVIVFDLGTCTTATVLSKEGELCGGMIMPGVQVSLDAMHERSSKLPAVKAKIPEHIIGESTEGCMESGAVIGTAAVIDGFAQRVRKELGYPVPCVVTGGLSSIVIPWCLEKVNYEPDLMLMGLNSVCLRTPAGIWGS